jgi:hypothetical protein
MVGGMNLSELGGVDVGGDAPLSRDAVKGGVVVLAGNPHGLAVGEAGGGGENHEVGCD